MPLKAVITADIVNSTLLKTSQEQKLKKQLQALLKPYSFEFYRGDSLQVFLDNPEMAFQLVLSMRTLAQKFLGKNNLPVCDLRASIGIGTVESIAAKPGNSRGEAFTLSGRGMDGLGGKSDKRMGIFSANETTNPGLDVLATFADYLIKRFTLKQAEVVYEMLPGITQQQAATNLGRSIATISQHTKAAGWDQLSYLIAQYPLLLKTI